MLRSLKTTASCIALAFAVSNVALAADHMNMVPAASASSSGIRVIKQHTGGKYYSAIDGGKR